MTRLFLRNVYIIETFPVEHPELCVNIDKTLAHHVRAASIIC
jgi:hypothetical protein